MACRDIGFHCRTSLVRIAGTLKSQRYISEVLEPVILLYIQRLPSALFQQDYARPHGACNIQECIFTIQIELLPCPACSSDLSPIENMWSKLAQRMTQNISPAATPVQLWQYVEAAWTNVPQGYV
ncbi:transposable element Tcb1 transposase [Trichonephila clavipes]|nr:transposable element Tcb1 transposase [Trichonephila clavipes]